MEFANQNGEIAHLDLKPENLLIAPGDVLKVTDFGLSERVNVMQGNIPRLSLGSWPYASPERIKYLGDAPDPYHWIKPGQRPAEDCRSDIFTFGLIFYEMLTGKMPYSMSRLDASQNIQGLANFYIEAFNQGTSQPWVPEIGHPLLEGCLHISIGERFRNFSHLRRNFEQTYRRMYAKVLDEADAVQAQGIKQAGNDLLDRAQSLFRVGHYREALKVYNSILIKEPANVEALLGAAHALNEGNETERAILMLQAALEKFPGLEIIRMEIEKLEAQNGTTHHLQ
jgi:serine/threonine protein kinase